MKKYFESLGLKEGASQEEIQASYDKLSDELDPAKNNNQEFFKEEYKKVQEAYDALSNSSILASDKVKIENTDKPPKSSISKIPFYPKPIKKSFFVKENLIVVLLIILTGHSFYLQTKVSEATKYAKRASSYASDATKYSKRASSYASEASSYASDAADIASEAADFASDAYYAAYANQCSFCP